MLFNFDMDSKDHSILLLVGQNALRSTLNLKSLEALRQRISTNFMFSTLEGNETKNYIISKLEASGATTNILSDPALQQIINASNGVPRIINQIMDKSLLLMSNFKSDIIDEEMAINAINEVSI